MKKLLKKSDFYPKNILAPTLLFPYMKPFAKTKYDLLTIPQTFLPR